MDLKKTLLLAHDLLSEKNVDHALIGGLALVNLGLSRATIDVDLMIEEENKEILKETFIHHGFTLTHESAEFIQFAGIGYIDVLLARRPISRSMLKNAQLVSDLKIKCLLPEDIIGLKIQAMANDPSREFQDKADVQFLIENHGNMNWDKIKSYAELFNKWDEIEEIKNKIKL